MHREESVLCSLTGRIAKENPAFSKLARISPTGAKSWESSLTTFVGSCASLRIGERSSRSRLKCWSLFHTLRLTIWKFRKESNTSGRISRKHLDPHAQIPPMCCKFLSIAGGPQENVHVLFTDIHGFHIEMHEQLPLYQSCIHEKAQIPWSPCSLAIGL